MKELKNMLNSSEDFKICIEKCINNAVGDDIRLDIQINGFDTGNGTPNRIWDFINRNMGLYLSEDNYISKPSNRGPWDFKPIFEKDTGTLYTLMREERFIKLKKDIIKGRGMHYAQALAMKLNKDLEMDLKQINFIPKTSADEEYMDVIVSKILSDLNIPNSIIRNHALILFSSKSYELLSLRCCIINSDLDIIDQDNWNMYIQVKESIVVDSMIPSEITMINPTLNLQFKQKATDKIGSRIIGELKTEKSNKKQENNK